MTKYPVIMVVMLLLFASVACSLSGEDDATPTRMFPTSTPLTPTPTLSVTLTPAASVTGAAQPVGTVPATITNCTPQRSWPQYMVAAGDTLGYIAEVTNSTIAQLTTANCLANPELIYVGQLLYVPVLPPAAPPPAITVVQTVVVTVEGTIEVGITVVPEGTVEDDLTVVPTSVPTAGD